MRRIKRTGLNVQVPTAGSKEVGDERGLVIVQFDEALSLMALTRDDATDFAIALLQAARSR